jgi:hypothetical protein
MSSKIKLEKVSYDEINNPNPDYAYFRKFKITKTIRSNGFLLVKTTKKKEYIETYGERKVKSK